MTKSGFLFVVAVVVVVVFDVVVVRGQTDCDTPTSKVPKQECCKEDVWRNCNLSAHFMNSSLKCQYKKIKSSEIPNQNVTLVNSPSKPEDLNVTIATVNGGYYFNIIWKIPKSGALNFLTGFLIDVTFQLDGVDRRILRLFHVTGAGALQDVSINEGYFIYDCIVPYSNVEYKISIRSLPSSGDSATATELKSSVNLPPSYKENENCTADWAALMWARVDPGPSGMSVKVCFRGAPPTYNFKSYVLALITQANYNAGNFSDDTRNIIIDPVEFYGKEHCEVFQVDKPNSYVAKLQPDASCSCYGKEKSCNHTFLIIQVQAMATSTTTTTRTTTTTTTSNPEVSPPAWLIAIIVIVIIILVALFSVVLCCLLDIIKKIHPTPPPAMKILLVYYPGEKSLVPEILKELIIKLMKNCSAKVDLLPKLKERNRFTSIAGRICFRYRIRPDDPLELSSCCSGGSSSCCSNSNMNEIKRKLMQYRYVMMFHTEESHDRYEDFNNNKSFPLKGCNLFLTVVNIYTTFHRFGSSQRTSTSLNGPLEIRDSNTLPGEPQDPLRTPDVIKDDPSAVTLQMERDVLVGTGCDTEQKSIEIPTVAIKRINRARGGGHDSGYNSTLSNPIGVNIRPHETDEPSCQLSSGCDLDIISNGSFEGSVKSDDQIDGLDTVGVDNETIPRTHSIGTGMSDAMEGNSGTYQTRGRPSAHEGSSVQGDNPSPSPDSSVSGLSEDIDSIISDAFVELPRRIHLYLSNTPRNPQVCRVIVGRLNNEPDFSLGFDLSNIITFIKVGRTEVVPPSPEFLI